MYVCLQQSVEMSVSKYEVERVLRRLSRKNTIVVGPVLDGHEFKGRFALDACCMVTVLHLKSFGTIEK